MQSITDLQNSLSELQDIINSTINPVFSDLQIGSAVLTPIIASHDQMILKIDEMTSFLNSGIIVGLKGDTGLQGIQGVSGVDGQNGVNGSDGLQGLQGIQGLSYQDTLIIKDNPSNFVTSLATLSELVPLTTELLPNSIYEIKCYVDFSTVSTTTGLYLALNTPVGSVDFVDISVPITNVQSSGTLRFLSPNSNLVNNAPAVKGTGVNVANQKLTAIITGHIETTATGGPLKIMVGSEVAGSAVTIGTLTKLFLNKVA